MTEGDRLAAVPVPALGAAVTACPGWDVARLISHVGRVHRWAATVLRDGAEAARHLPREPHPENERLADWYRDSRDLLLRELDARDPDAEADVFTGRGTVRFWLRRQAHEVAMHRWDAQDAVSAGGAIAFEPDLAADGIDEWLRVFVPRHLARQGGVPPELHGATLRLHRTDTAGPDPVLRLTGTQPSIEVDTAADTTVSGTAADLLLTVWHRPPADKPVATDPELCARVLDLIHI